MHAVNGQKILEIAHIYIYDRHDPSTCTL
jgi:hypothetical protein